MRGERSSRPKKIELLRPSCTTYLGTAAGLTSAGELPGKEGIQKQQLVASKARESGKRLCHRIVLYQNKETIKHT